MRRRPRPTLWLALLAAAGTAFAAGTPGATAATPTPSPIPVDVAPGAPGALSHYDLARKDCLGTARNTSSKVWFTVAGGVLSDVYYPTIDNTNVETLRYLVTDGSTFTDLQGRDTTYTVAAIPGTGGMGCRVTTTAKSGKWSLTTDYVTDPATNALVMRNSFTGSGLYRLYARFDPTVNGNGGGGSGNAGPHHPPPDPAGGPPGPPAAGPPPPRAPPAPPHPP